MTDKKDILNFKDKDGKELHIRVRLPNDKEHQQGQIVAAKAMRNALDNGVIVKAKLDVYLREQGLWNDEKEAEANKRIEELRKLEVALGSGKLDGKKLNKVEGKSLAFEIKKKRDELDNLLAVQRQYDEITVESLGQNAKFDYFVSTCVINDDTGEPLFSSVDDYKTKSGEPYAIASAWKLGMMLYPIDKDYEKKLIENKFLVKYGFVDENLRLVNDKGKLVDSEGRLVNEMGNYITEDGKLCDKFGNLLDDDGFVQLEAEYED